jgi:hypothetical protein
MSNDPNDIGWVGCLIPVVIFGIAGLIAFGIYGCVQHFKNEQLIQNTVTQDNHKEVVRLKKDVITCLKLRAKHAQEWKFKTCDDYELVTIQNSQDWNSTGRGSGYWSDSVEIWMKVKRPFVLEMNYKNEKGNDKFLYLKMDFMPDK